MNSLLDDTGEEDSLPLRGRHLAQNRDREITLGTTMILLIFFALAVYGAALFGFGYSLGSKHDAATPTTLAASGPELSTSGSKPSPSSPVGSNQAQKTTSVDPAVFPYTPPPRTEPPAPITRVEPLAPETTQPRATATPTPAAAPAATSSPALPGSGTPIGPPLLVQIAAVSHQEDAQMIASTLEHRGYTVNVRTEPDKLFHVQIGPFYARKDADAMKARLLADGFNAYIK